MELLKVLKDITAHQAVKMEAMTAKINELEEIIKYCASSNDRPNYVRIGKSGEKIFTESLRIMIQ